MKKIFLTFSIIILVVLTTKAQNLQIHHDFGENRNFFTSTLEMFKPDKWGNTFFFVDMDYNNGVELAYWEIAREIKVGKMPLAIHVEHNGGLTNNFSFGNAWLLGPSFSQNAKDFSKGFTIMALYKYIENTPEDAPHNYQITGVWYINFLNNKMTFSGFVDFWKHSFYGDYTFLSEPQIWYHLSNNFSIGGEVEMSNNFVDKGFFIAPTLAVKWDFK